MDAGQSSTEALAKIHRYRNWSRIDDKPQTRTNFGASQMKFNSLIMQALRSALKRCCKTSRQIGVKCYATASLKMHSQILFIEI